jgi:hypothetical protein
VEAIFLVAGLVAIFTYTLFKISALQILKGSVVDADKLHWYTIFSWEDVITAICFTGITKFKLLRVTQQA